MADGADIIRLKNIDGLTEAQAEEAERIDGLYQARIVRQGNRIAQYVNFLSEQGLLENFNRWEEQRADQRETGPHSRECGIRPHPHGVMCSNDCPTCHGEALY